LSISEPTSKPCREGRRSMSIPEIAIRDGKKVLRLRITPDELAARLGLEPGWPFWISQCMGSQINITPSRETLNIHQEVPAWPAPERTYTFAEIEQVITETKEIVAGLLDDNKRQLIDYVREALKALPRKEEA